MASLTPNGVGFIDHLDDYLWQAGNSLDDSLWRGFRMIFWSMLNDNIWDIDIGQLFRFSLYNLQDTLFDRRIN